MKPATFHIDSDAAKAHRTWIRLHNASLRSRHEPVPPELVDLEDAADAAFNDTGGVVFVVTVLGEQETQRENRGNHPQADLDELLTQEGAAVVAGVTPRTIRNWFDHEGLPAVMVKSWRRVRRGDLLEHIATCGQRAGRDMAPSAGRRPARTSTTSTRAAA